ncbi:hypothetical protein C0048_17785, partial [Pseudomonas aeruginosa]
LDGVEGRQNDRLLPQVLDQGAGQHDALVGLMLPLFCGVLSSLLTRLFCAVPRTSVARIAWG